MNRNTTLKTPWDAQGLQHHPEDHADWRDNDEFKAKLKLRGTERGRSAAFFKWEVVEADRPDLLGAILPMFITDVAHVLMQGRGGNPGGIVEGTWFVVKRGQNYGVTPSETAPGAAQDSTTEPLAAAPGA